jgi:hypothetical protein
MVTDGFEVMLDAGFEVVMDYLFAVSGGEVLCDKPSREEA